MSYDVVCEIFFGLTRIKLRADFLAGRKYARTSAGQPKRLPCSSPIRSDATDISLESNDLNFVSHVGGCMPIGRASLIVLV